MELRLDLGCGPNPQKAGFLGVDKVAWPNVGLALDLFTRKPGIEEWQALVSPNSDGYDLFEPWPWESGTVLEIHSSHFVEHTTRRERVFFVNEMYRVLAPGAKATLVAPHWKSCRAYGDMTHDTMPISEFWMYYLSRAWREVNAPHNDFYTCDFEATWGYSLDPAVTLRNQEYQQFALRYYTEATQDLIATLTKKA